MTTTTIERGCNMPCVPYSPERPSLWWYAVEATETGLVSALADEDDRRSDDRFAHLVFFPTWSSGEIAIYQMVPGEKARVEAAADDTLRVVSEAGEVSFPNKIVVLAHASLDREALEKYYSKEG
jgi:hypothetical protein